MKCPTCLSTMRCISEINPVPGQPGKNRMDLHCYNRNEPREPNYCRALCHMGVITEDPKNWVCHDYNLQIEDEGIIYHLCGFDLAVQPTRQYRNPFIKQTTLMQKNNSKYLITMDFIPLDTGDDMHLDALRLVRRLKNLSAFS